MMDWLRRYFGGGEQPRVDPALASDEDRRAYPDMLFLDQLREQQLAQARAKGFTTAADMAAAQPDAFPFLAPTHKQRFPVYDPTVGRMVLRAPDEVGQPLSLDETMRGVESWLGPLDNPSRVMGAVITGQNPLNVFDSTLADEERPPTLGRALVDYGAPEWVGAASELLAVPDPTFAGNVRDMFLLASMVPSLRGLGRLFKHDPEGAMMALNRMLPEGRFGELEDLSTLPELQTPEQLEEVALLLAERARNVREAHPQGLSARAEEVLGRLEGASARAQLHADALRYRDGKTVVPGEPSWHGVDRQQRLRDLADIALQGGVLPGDIPSRVQSVDAIHAAFNDLAKNLDGLAVPADDPKVQQLVLALQALGDERSVMAADLRTFTGPDGKPYYEWADLLPIGDSIDSEVQAMDLLLRTERQGINMVALSDEAFASAADQIARSWRRLDSDTQELARNLLFESSIPDNVATAALNRPAMTMQPLAAYNVEAGRDMAQTRMMMLDITPVPAEVDDAMLRMKEKGVLFNDAVNLMKDSDDVVRYRGMQVFKERLEDAGFSSEDAVRISEMASQHYGSLRQVSMLPPDAVGMSNLVADAAPSLGMNREEFVKWAKAASDEEFAMTMRGALDLPTEDGVKFREWIVNNEDAARGNFNISLTPEDREGFRAIQEAVQEAHKVENWSPVELMDAIEERWGTSLDEIYQAATPEEFKGMVASELRLMGAADDKVDEMAEGIFQEQRNALGDGPSTPLLDPLVADGPRSHASASEAIDEALLMGTAMNRVRHYAGIKPEDLQQVFRQEGEAGVRSLLDDIDWTGQSYDTVEEGYEALFDELRMATGIYDDPFLDRLKERFVREFNLKPEDGLKQMVEGASDADLEEMLDILLRMNPDSDYDRPALLALFRRERGGSAANEMSFIEAIERSATQEWDREDLMRWAKSTPEEGLADLARELAETDLRDHPTSQSEYEALLRHYRSQLARVEYTPEQLDELAEQAIEEFSNGIARFPLEEMVAGMTDADIAAMADELLAGGVSEGFMGRDALIRVMRHVRDTGGSRTLPSVPDLPEGFIAPGVRSWESAFDDWADSSDTAARLRSHFRDNPRSLSGRFRGQARLDEVIGLPGARSEHVRFRGNAEEQARIDELAESMRLEGYRPDKPITIWVEQDGSAVIAEGNHRVRAAQQAGIEFIPIDVRYFGGSDGDPAAWKPSFLRDYLGMD